MMNVGKIRKQAARRYAKKTMLNIMKSLSKQTVNSTNQHTSSNEISCPIEARSFSRDVPPITTHTESATESEIIQTVNEESTTDSETTLALSEDELESEVSSTDDTPENIQTNNIPSFVEELAHWQANHNIPNTALSQLLRLLKSRNIDVPLDARTIVKTPRTGQIHSQNKSGGTYIYIGVQQGIRNLLKEKDMNNIDEIVLSVNIDGLPVYKSTNTSVWPIQCAVTNVKSIENIPFVAAVFSGSGKPQDTEFLDDFLNEVKELYTNGIDGKLFSIKNVICDAPARSLIKETVYFNARYGCDFCNIQGTHKEGRMLFLNTGTPRTDLSFRGRHNSEHHKGESRFTDLNLDMIRDFPPDPMHCVDLGVMKKLLTLWRDGPKPYKISATSILRMSDYLVKLRPFTPENFNRKPRAVNELKYWKATEFRQFLMYTGPVVLRFILGEESDSYKHFMCLSSAICLLYHEKLTRDHKDFAAELLTYFVSKGKQLYGDRFITYNVHVLHHLAQAASNFKTLEYCSGYKFENNMSRIKRSIRGTGNPAVQIANRLSEIGKSRISNETTMVPKVNKFYVNKNGRFCEVVQLNGTTATCKLFTRTSAVYDSPLDSRILGVHKSTHWETKHINTSDLKENVFGIPLSIFEENSKEYVFIPLMHTL